MNFMNRFKKPVDDVENNVPEEEHIDISVKPEPAKRINKLVVYGVGLFAIIAVGIALSPGNDNAKNKPKQEVSSTNEIFTENKLKEAENKNKTLINKAAKNGSSSHSEDPYNDKIPPGFEKDERGNLRKISSERQTAQAAVSQSAPAPITPYEKYVDESKKAYYKRQLDEEQNNYKEEKQAQKSDIFFNLDGHKKQAVRSKEYSSPETAANRYYNDGVFPDKNVDHFDDDYIQVIGRKGE